MSIFNVFPENIFFKPFKKSMFSSSFLSVNVLCIITSILSYKILEFLKIFYFLSLFLFSSMISSISFGVTMNGFIGKSLILPVTRKESCVCRESIVTS